MIVRHYTEPVGDFVKHTLAVRWSIGRTGRYLIMTWCWC